MSNSIIETLTEFLEKRDIEAAIKSIKEHPFHDSASEILTLCLRYSSAPCMLAYLEKISALDGWGNTKINELALSCLRALLAKKQTEQIVYFFKNYPFQDSELQLFQFLMESFTSSFVLAYLENPKLCESLYENEIDKLFNHAQQKPYLELHKIRVAVVTNEMLCRRVSYYFFLRYIRAGGPAWVYYLSSQPQYLKHLDFITIENKFIKDYPQLAEPILNGFKEILTSSGSSPQDKSIAANYINMALCSENFPTPKKCYGPLTLALGRYYASLSSPPYPAKTFYKEAWRNGMYEAALELCLHYSSKIHKSLAWMKLALLTLPEDNQRLRDVLQKMEITLTTSYSTVPLILQKTKEFFAPSQSKAQDMIEKAEKIDGLIAAVETMAVAASTPLQPASPSPVLFTAQLPTSAPGQKPAAPKVMEKPPLIPKPAVERKCEGVPAAHLIKRMYRR